MKSRPFANTSDHAPFLLGIEESLFMTGFASLFDAQFRPSPAVRAEHRKALFQQYLPSLFSEKLLETANTAQKAEGFPAAYLPQSAYNVRAFPQQVVFEFDKKDRITLRYDLYPMFIGGGASQWNNVAMAQAAARIATGSQVKATFESRSGTYSPPPLVSSPYWGQDGLRWRQWRLKHLLLPMEQAALHPNGTAYKYLARMDLGGYRAFYKTGTLGDGGEENTNTLLFIIGRMDRKGEFSPDQTVAGYLSIEKAGGASIKFTLAKKILPEVVKYLATRDRKANSR
jgi:hypothetical protein